MALSRIVMRLARNPGTEFAGGDDHRGYALTAPLTADGHLDEAAYAKARDACTVRRFAPDEDPADGRLVVIDYARTTAEMAAVPPQQWLRTYTAHGTGGTPYDSPGRSDITCDVAVDQLALIEPPVAIRTQADFLRAHGIDELVAEGRATWEELGLGGGLEAIAGRSRTTEAAALLDPSGPGAFTVLEWTP